MFKALESFLCAKINNDRVAFECIKNKGETMSYNIEALQLKVAQLSRKTHELGIPVMILFEGVPASGKTRLSNELLLNLDAKYTDFIATKSPEAHNLRYQFLQKYGIHYRRKVISIFILEVGIHIISTIKRIKLNRINIRITMF